MNSIRSMLVHVDGTPRCAARLMIARELAQLHEARLTALYATTPPLVDAPYSYAASAISAHFLQELHTRWLLRARATFDQAKAARPGEVAWAELSDVFLVRGVAEQAMFADLLVLGQHDPNDPAEQELPADFVESVLIQSGKPALVIPYAGKFRSVGTTALIAWKPSAETARALKAALPLLQRAKQVHVVMWDTSAPLRVDGDRLDLAHYLRLHGIEATLHVHREEPRNVGEALLSQAADIDADLLVMGCYGHSRAREFVLGGVSRTVLQSMTVPVLMSH
jgi:nucleotide-binding universal stress UspA family protein